MALDFFKKLGLGKSTPPPAGGAAPDAEGHAPEAGTGIHRDPRKAKRFFEHGDAVATGNPDFAVEMYLRGLEFEPDNLSKHEALREVALKRKVAGGKPASWTEKLKLGAGKTPLQKLLTSEMLWTKDPLNVALALEVIEHAAALQEFDPQVKMEPVVAWVGRMFLDTAAKSKRATKAQYVQAREALRAVHSYELAIEASHRAIGVDPDDGELLRAHKDLEAENTMRRGRYEEAATAEQAGYARMAKDIDKARQLDQEDRLTKTDEALEQEVARKRREFQENPQDHVRLAKLVEALIQQQSDASENEAMTLLRVAYDQTGQYKFKAQAGAIRMKQFNRHLRQLREQLEARPQDAALRQRFEALVQERLTFELAEYTERVKNYPTDLGMKFELGRRLHAAKRFDDAIGAFQDAQADPKYRAHSLVYLGQCYQTKGWFEEAIASFKRGLEVNGGVNERLTKELSYLLMTSLEQSAGKNRSLEQAREAEQIASQIVQSDINYRDIRQRREAIRGLVQGLLQKPA